MTAIVRKLKINRVASVDRGANEGAMIVLMKRADETKRDDRRLTMSVHETVDIAKAIVDRGYGRNTLFNAMQAGGDELRKRRPELTREQAFAEYIQKDPTGRAFFKARQMAPIDQDRTVNDTLPASAGSGLGAYDALVALAEALCKANPDLTMPAAFVTVYVDPANRALVARYKNELAAA